MEDSKYPVGKFEFSSSTFDQLKESYISTIETFYDKILVIKNQFNPLTLENTYRDGGWTALQVIHHCADSHMHALLRFKITLTENNPSIKPYEQAPTALLADYSMDPDIALNILYGVHEKWTYLIKSMQDDDFKKSYIHPEYQKQYTLEEALAMYDWHCRHHLGHLLLCLKK